MGSLGLCPQGVPPSLGQDSHGLNQVQVDLDQQSPPHPGHHLRQGELHLDAGWRQLPHCQHHPAPPQQQAWLQHILVLKDLAAKFMQPEPLALQYLVMGGGQDLQQVPQQQEEPQDCGGGPLEQQGQDLHQEHLCLQEVQEQGSEDAGRRRRNF